MFFTHTDKLALTEIGLDVPKDEEDGSQGGCDIRGVMTVLLSYLLCGYL